MHAQKALTFLKFVLLPPSSKYKYIFIVPAPKFRDLAPALPLCFLSILKWRLSFKNRLFCSFLAVVKSVKIAICDLL